MSNLGLSKETLCAIVVICLAFLGRGAFLEYIDLIDPTEARYASIAQEMVLSGDWITPKLPMPEGIIPYMGKPPLHFWLTAASYSVFGFDEWSARFPSWIAAALILIVVAVFTSQHFGKPTALIATLITMSSPLFFFLAGASVTDVTLTACISLSVLFLFRSINSDNKPKTQAFLSSFFCALAFLCKGPVGVVLVGLPFLLWTALSGKRGWIRKLPWVGCIGIFVITSAPWFIAQEIKTPGATWYFFWNENIARYLLKDYGDKYGTGHVYPYGSAWAMLLISFLPWAPILTWAVYQCGIKSTLAKLKDDPNFYFILSWAISAPLFFTFVRQLHAMYILPAIPGFAILTAVMLDRLWRTIPSQMNWMCSSRTIGLWVFISGIIITIGILLEPSLPSLLISTGLVAIFVVVIKTSVDTPSMLNSVTRLSAMIVAPLLLSIPAFTPYINDNRSSEKILQEIVKEDSSDPRHIHRVGITTRNTYSHYWTAQAWENELSEKMTVEYITEENIANSNVCHFLLKSGSPVPDQLAKHFRLVKQIGKWLLYQRVVV